MFDVRSKFTYTVHTIGTQKTDSIVLTVAMSEAKINEILEKNGQLLEDAKADNQEFSRLLGLIVSALNEIAPKSKPKEAAVKGRKKTRPKELETKVNE